MKSFDFQVSFDWYTKHLRKLSGTAEGNMTNDSIAIQIEVDKLPQDFNLVAEYGQDLELRTYHDS